MGFMDTLRSQETQTLASWQEGDIATDILCVEGLLDRGIKSEDKVPQELAQRLLQAGGKRIRPLLLCLVYRALEKDPRFSPRGTLNDLHTLAAVAEWVHTATLFHDDVLDNSPTRRNLTAAHVLEGNKVAILVGDFVYAEAFSVLMEMGHLEVSKKLADTIKRLVEGELWQHRYSTHRNIVKSEYLKVIECKTAALFAWATQTGAWVSGVPVVENAYEFGMNLGLAFQIADDFIDTFSLDPLKASDEEVLEWALSAPPLPLILAAEKYPIVNEIWTSLHLLESRDAMKNKALELQQYCHDESVIAESKAFLDLHLAKARTSLAALGSPQSLEQAIVLLESRGKAGLELALRGAHA